MLQAKLEADYREVLVGLELINAVIDDIAPRLDEDDLQEVIRTIRMVRNVLTPVNVEQIKPEIDELLGFLRHKMN